MEDVGLLDVDLLGMSRETLIEEVKRLRAGIRAHRNNSGHNLCWYVPELWDLLPDKARPAPAVPPTEEFLTKCRAYRESLDQEEITEEIDVVSLKRLIDEGKA